MRFWLHFKYFAFELYRKHFRIDYFWNLKNKEIKKTPKYQNQFKYRNRVQNRVQKSVGKINLVQKVFEMMKENLS